MSTPAPSAEQSVDLKNRWLAAGLALLLPGLGHLYQGRTFKAAVYCVCILGLFFTGQALGEWKVVYLSDSDAGGRIAAGGGLVKRLLQGYGAQFPVGVFAWPAIVQSDRYLSDEEGRVRLDEPLVSELRGGIWINTLNGPQPLVRVAGTVTLDPAGGIVRGHFEGMTEDGRPIEFDLGRVRDLGRQVSANEFRTVEASIEELPAGLEAPDDARPYLAGAIPRPFTDRYQVPLGDQGEDNLTAELGGRLEIAYVFTWVAGLLNILAIWDALDGPAYGIGNEPDLNRKKRRRKDDEEPQDADRARHREPVGRPG